MHQISISWLRGIRIQRDIYSCYGHSGWQFDTTLSGIAWLSFLPSGLPPTCSSWHLSSVSDTAAHQFFTFLVFQLTHLQFTTLFLIYLVLGSTLQGLGFSCCLSLEWGCTCRRDVCALGNYLSLIEWIKSIAIRSCLWQLGWVLNSSLERQGSSKITSLCCQSVLPLFFFSFLSVFQSRTLNQLGMAIHVIFIPTGFDYNPKITFV